MKKQEGKAVYVKGRVFYWSPKPVKTSLTLVGIVKGGFLYG